MQTGISRQVWALAVSSLLFTTPVLANLDEVSGLQAGDPPVLTEVRADGDRAAVAVNLANGFPVWYQDANNGRKYQLCLDSALTIVPGVVVNPCEYEPPMAAPPSFPANFGAEAIYWSAVAQGTYTSTGDLTNTALLVLGLEATGANEAPLADGSQAVFSRIRLRVDVPVAGTYRVTHPYGTRDYVIATPGGRAINQTLDYGLVGLDVAQNFLAAMPQVVIPLVEPVPFIPSINAEIVNLDGNTIGPFLEPAVAHGGVLNPANPATFTGGPITVGGARYIGLPFAPNPANPLLPDPVLQPVTGSPLGNNFFSIELLDPPVGFQLNPGNTVNPQLFQVDNFLLIGKLFNDGANLRPVANNDLDAAAINRSVSIDVVSNDTDVVSGTNAHGINIQAIAVADPLTAGPRAQLTSGAEVTAPPVSSSARGLITLRVNNDRLIPAQCRSPAGDDGDGSPYPCGWPDGERAGHLLSAPDRLGCALHRQSQWQPATLKPADPAGTGDQLLRRCG